MNSAVFVLFRMQNGVQQLQEAVDTFFHSQGLKAPMIVKISRIKYSKQTELIMHEIGSARAGYKHG